MYRLNAASWLFLLRYFLFFNFRSPGNLSHIFIIPYDIGDEGENPADWVCDEDCLWHMELRNQENCEQPDYSKEAGPDK